MPIKNRTIHFVGTVPLGKSLFGRIIDKAISKTGIIPPLHRTGNDFFIPWRKPVRSPHAISIHLLHEFKKFGTVKLYSLYEKGIIDLGPDDIFIGQAVPKGGFGSGFRPNEDDPESITSRTLRKYKNSNHNKYLITPYTSDPLYISWLKNLAENYADKVILVATGKIWTDNWIRTPFGSIDESRVLRVDNAIEPSQYPFVKKKFNPKGQRKFLYIGHTAWYKNTEELERFALSIPNFQGGHIGDGVIKGWKKIANFAELTEEFMSKIALEYDVFVNTSSGDAQATTILENICFGFPIACTLESGYNYPSIIRLDVADTAYNVKKLNELQQMDEGELQKLVNENQRYVAEKHTWKIFLDQVTQFMGLV